MLVSHCFSEAVIYAVKCLFGFFSKHALTEDELHVVAFSWLTPVISSAFRAPLTTSSAVPGKNSMSGSPSAEPHHRPAATASALHP